MITKLVKYLYNKLKARVNYKKVKQYCRKEPPQIIYSDGSWVDIIVTPDQSRIQDYLNLLQIENKTILHVGIGNSTIAKQLHSKNIIDGITIVEEEIKFAKELNIPNYTCFVLNKYSNDTLDLPHKYDYIIDNNLSSYTCCVQHFEKMIHNYYHELLNLNGSIITDLKGMAYYQPGSFPITINDLKRLLPEAKINNFDNIVVITKNG